MAYVDNLLTRNERVLLSARRHPIYVVRRTAVLVIGVLALWLLALLAIIVLSSVGGVAVDLILAFLLVVVSLVPLAMIVYRFLFWWNERYYVTSYRILQVEGLLNRKTFDSALEMINGVEMSQGMLGRMFNFGTIHILTGSDVGVNDIDGVSKPFEFKRTLLEAKLAYGAGESGIDADSAEIPVSGGSASLYEQDTAKFRPVGDVPSDRARMVVALTELRNAGVLSQSEYDEKLRRLMEGQSTVGPGDPV